MKCDCCRLDWVALAPTTPVEPYCTVCREHGWYPDEPIERRIARAEAHEAVYRAKADEALAEKDKAEKARVDVGHSRLRWREALARLVLEHDVEGACWCTTDGGCRTWAHLHEINPGIGRQVEKMVGMNAMQLDKELRTRTLEELADAEDAEVEWRVQARLDAQASSTSDPTGSQAQG